MDGVLSGGETSVTGDKLYSMEMQPDIREKVEQLFLEVFDFNKPMVYYPVRHHSVGVTLHLKETISLYQPDCILIEGPENANHLLPLIVEEGTKPPFALYYSYKDKVRRLSAEAEDYRCYYPFMACSPEYVALKEAKALGIPAYFMDLPYREILYAKKAGAGKQADEGKSSYNDDHYLAGHKAVKQMCERAGVRCYDEFWEKYFELNGMSQSTYDYVKNLLLYCYISRENTPESELDADGCLARERYMAGRIKEYAKQYRKLLVVTGGFHTPGLYSLSRTEVKPCSVAAAGKADEQVYLMAYSEEALDALNGYASGMPYAAFYTRVYQEMQEEGEQPFSKVVLEGLVRIAHQLRKRKEAISTFDEICAYNMAKSLAALRGKREPGAFELYDAVLSNYVKGEWNLSTDEPVRQFKRFMMGNGIGAISDKAGVPPIVADFEAQCKKCHIEIGDTSLKERVLEIFAKENHRQTSMFFHRMAFLQTDFARRTKGPNLRLRKDKRLIRETWKYKWSGAVIAALIDQSVKGGTVQKACETLLSEQLKGNVRSGEAAALLAAAFEMGLLDRYGELLEQVSDSFRRETDFYEVVDALSYLTMLYELRGIYQVEQDAGLVALISLCYIKAVGLLDAVCGVKEEQMEQALEAVKSLYDLVHQIRFHLPEELLWNRLDELLKMKDIHPGMEGVMLGILYGSGTMEKDVVLSVARGYMRGTHEKMLKTAGFLRGLFYTAKDLVFDGDYFVNMVDELLNKLDNSEFVRLLPELRLAFSGLQPYEVDRLAAQAAGIYGKSAKDITKKAAVPAQLLAYARQIDSEVGGLAVSYHRTHDK